MSVSESFYGDAPGYFPPRTTVAKAAPDIIQQLTEALENLMEIESAGRAMERNFDMFGRPRPVDSNTIIIRGKLLADADKLYPVISDNFRKLGYTPALQREGETDIVVAFDGIIKGREISSPAWLHGLLLVVTLLTTTLSGAAFQGYDLNVIVTQVVELRHFSYLLRVLGAGAPFALTLILILGIHEMGHYIAARRHKIAVTLPYFIPLPFVSFLGTLGAVIFIKEALTNRKSLFDVGISGPLAGFVVALIAFIIGMTQPAAMQFNHALRDLALSMQGVFDGLGMPILLQVIGHTIRPDANLGLFVSKQPIALAAWFGMLLTVLNLLPIGQLDGGHVVYTLFGRFAWTIAYT
ncbi:MAG TPA: site-2 protease family protein, partial [Aggregatilineales bacterium]|nr:site-2 protease family protein [Aggregatilineales bacterium]